MNEKSPSISVLFPYRSDLGGRRDELFSFSLRRWKLLYPHAELCVGVNTDLHFNRSKAINLAASKSRGEILIVADTDTLFEKPALDAAIEIARTEGRMVFPYSEYRKIDRATSDWILAGRPNLEINATNLAAEKIERGYVSGVVVLPRAAFFAVGGFDDRFEDWGCEDEAFYWAIKTLIGKVSRTEGAVHHLWHPPAETSISRDGKYLANRALLAKYQAAAEFAPAMKILCAGRVSSTVSSVAPDQIENRVRSLELCNHGYALLQDGQFDEAEENFAKSLALNIESAQAWLNYGVSRMNRNDFDGAQRFFDQALASDPSCTQAWRAKGQCFAQAGKISEAEACFLKALQILPESYEVQVDLAFVYAQTQRKNLALLTLDAVLKSSNRDPRAAELRAYLLQS